MVLWPSTELATIAQWLYNDYFIKQVYSRLNWLTFSSRHVWKNLCQLSTCSTLDRGFLSYNKNTMLDLCLPCMPSLNAQTDRVVALCYIMPQLHPIWIQHLDWLMYDIHGMSWYVYLMPKSYHEHKNRLSAIRFTVTVSWYTCERIKKCTTYVDETFLRKEQMWKKIDWHVWFVVLRAKWISVLNF